jgi:thiamine biosynthesis lipoprotein
MNEIRLHAFGRACHVVIEGSDGTGDELLALCQDELARLEQKFSSYLPNSITSQINECAGSGSYVALDAETQSLFQYVDALWNESKHIFDPTTRIIQECFSNEGDLLASQDQLKGILKLVGWRGLEVTPHGAHLVHKGMLIDLNSCVRPYALDSLRKILLGKGVSSASVQMDQDVVTIGKQPDGANWLVGVRVPQGTRAAIIRLKLNNKGFAMRGDFEQTTLQNGEHFGRALSPVDGQAIPGLLSVVVIADNCLTACSAASIARLKTEATGLKWLEKLGLPWMAVDREFHCHGPLSHNSRRTSGH